MPALLTFVSFTALNQKLVTRRRTGDLKPDNILVGDGHVAKVADFGESRHFACVVACSHVNAHDS